MIIEKVNSQDGEDFLLLGFDQEKHFFWITGWIRARLIRTAFFTTFKPALSSFRRRVDEFFPKKKGGE